MIYLFDKITHELLEAEIVSATENMLLSFESNWNFNWTDLSEKGKVFLLKLKQRGHQTEGAICLKIINEMLIMEALELAPHNVGTHKRYDYVAGCLIAFACRESFKLSGAYQGILSFVSKTKLINWYKSKYGAKQALGQRMYIDWKEGKRLIEEYLNKERNQK